MAVSPARALTVSSAILENRAAQKRARLVRGLDGYRRAEQHGGPARDIIGLVVGQEVGVYSTVGLGDA